MKKVLVAGATGYLGKYIVNELKSRGYWVRVLIRKGSQKKLFTNVDDFFVGEITKPKTLIGIAENIDWVFSTIGITRQEDGLTYMDVDYQGNVNLLYEAEKSGVEKFEYISAINGDKQRHLKIFEAKERFVNELKSSGLDYCIMRPNGFFSDMKDFYLNFNNPYQSHRVNPLRPEYLVTTSYAREYAQAIISNLMKESIQKPDFWSRSATDLLTACIWYLKEERPDICDLPHVCAMITSNDTALLELLQTNVQTEQMTISIYNAMKRGAEGQTSGVIGSLQGAIAQINTPELMYIFGGNDFSLDINNPSNPILLTVGSYPTLTTTFAPLCSLVITVATKLMNQPNKKQSFVLLDEAPTVFIPNIEILPNTGRSNKIATVLMCQDLAQLTDGYGKEKADVLFASCNNHFYGRVASSKTSEILSKQFGKQDRTFITASRGGKHLEVSKNYNRSESTQERDVIKPSEFLDLNVGEFAGITVESNYPKFKKQFLQIKRPEFNGLSKITNKSDVSSYYRQVREDVRQMLSRFETTSRNGSKTAILNHTQTNSLKGDKNNTFDLIGD